MSYIKEIPVVEFLGPPKSGKTENADKIVRKLNQQGFSVRYIQDQVRDAPVQDEIKKIKWAIHETARLIIEAKGQSWDLILVDRGGWAQYASLVAHLNNTVVKRGVKEIEEIKQALQSAKAFIAEEKYFVLFEINLEEALYRDQKLDREDQPAGRIINRSFLHLLEQSYKEVKVKLPEHRRRIINGQEEFPKNQDKLLKFLLSITKGNGNDKANSEQT